MNKPLQHRSICPLASSLDLFGDKWTLLVIRDLACGKSQFKDFMQSPEKIATNILSSRLARLLALGLIETFASTLQPGRQAYRLTAKGETLVPVLQALVDWGLANIDGTRALLRPADRDEKEQKT